MPLDDRRLAMLREMGVPFWQPLARTDAVEPAEPQHRCGSATGTSS